MSSIFQYKEKTSSRQAKINYWIAFLVLFLSFIQLASIAQTTSHSEMLKQAMYLTKTDQYDSSIAIAVSVQEALKESVKTQTYANTFRVIAENYLNQSKYKKADSLLKEGFSILESLPGDNSLLLADFNHSFSRNLGAQNKYDESLNFEKKALDIWNDVYGKNHPLIAGSYRQIGFNLRLKGVYDSALILYNEAIHIYGESPNDYSGDLAGCYFDAGWVYAAKGHLGKALEFNLKSLEIRERLYGENNLNTGNTINMLGWCYNSMGYHIKALEYYKRTLDIRISKLGKLHPNVAVSYLAIGNLYHNLGQYDKAIPFMEEGTQIWISKFGENDRTLVRNYNSLAKVYQAKGDIIQSISYLEKAIKVAEIRLEKYHPDLFQTYRILAKQYQKNKDYTNQLSSLTKAELIATKTFGLNHQNFAYIKKDLAEYFKMNGDLQTAAKLHQQALQIMVEKLGNTHPDVASQHIYIGEIASDMKDFPKSLEEYKKALKSALFDFDSGKIDSTQGQDAIGSRLIALKAFSEIGDVMIMQWQQSNSHNDQLKEALKTYEKAIHLIDDVRRKYTSEEDKQQLYEGANSIYDHAITVAIQLYEITGEDSYLEKGFLFSEKSKSFILLNALNENIARNFSDLPDSLFEKDQLLKAGITHTETRLLKAKSVNNKKQIESYRPILFELKNQQEILHSHLEMNYPKYFDLKYNEEYYTSSEVIDRLTDPQTAIIEYFVADTIVHVFIMSREGKKYVSLPKNHEFKSLISDFRKTTGDLNYINQNSKLADQTYTNSAFKLYDIYVAPILQSLKPKVENLIIIGDEQLNQINFEALLTKEIDFRKNVDYSILPYLIKDYQITYAYSTNFLLKTQSFESKPSLKLYGGFTPASISQKNIPKSMNQKTAHKSSTLATIELSGALNEVENIGKILNGEKWTGLEATESLFKKESGNYRILHLATHGLINNDSPLLSELIFNGDSINDGLLNIGEIYGLSLHADLVVLSACNSGIGKSVKGEGNMSISRAFSYAGCPSVIMSFWKVPDNTTEQLMLNLYNALQSSQHKGASLRSAKLKYLSEVKDFNKAHPFYWASFVLMGDHNKIQIDGQSIAIYCWFFAGIIFLIILFYHKRLIQLIK